MNPTPRTNSVDPSPRTARDWLGLLRGQWEGGQSPAGVEEILNGLSSAVDRVVVEHEALSEELIGAYEQLGVIFEVAKKLPTVKTESAIVAMFVDSLSQSFPAYGVYVAKDCEGDAWVAWGQPRDIPPWIQKALLGARRDGSMTIEARPTAESNHDIEEAMVAPVLSGQDFVCALVLSRGATSSRFRAVDMGLIESLTSYCGDLIRTHRLVRELREMSYATVRSLVSAVDQKDEYTSGHSLRVAYYAMMLAKRLGLSEKDLQMLHWSALLHDVGKIGIRDDVLKKTGKLTNKEFAHMKEHPVRSHTIVQGIPPLRGAMDGVLYHHEHFAGTGYPEGLKGEDIPLQARIVQVADIFDALTSNRSYRKAFDWQQALKILRDEAGKTVDPAIFLVFETLMRDILSGDPQAWDRLFAQASDADQGDNLNEREGGW